MSSSDDDRIAYLAGDDDQSLSAQDRADLDELRALLRSPAAWAEPDSGLEDRVVAAVAAESAGSPRSQRTPSRARRLRLSWSPRRTLALGGVVLAAVIAAVIIVSTSNHGSQQLRFAMVLSGTTLAPGAHGQAELTKTTAGWRIELNATGLPRLANGRYYQAWLKNRKGILVPVGTFNQPAHITLWAGVPATAFPTLTVTVQQANGNPASSGKRVLVGTIHPKK
jgi:Anti-sigma-K factor rskA